MEAGNDAPASALPEDWAAGTFLGRIATRRGPEPDSARARRALRHGARRADGFGAGRARRFQRRGRRAARPVSCPARRQLLSPVDLQCVKACGVTFAVSAIERVIEERARGDWSVAAAIRERLEGRIGGSIRAVEPGLGRSRQPQGRADRGRPVVAVPRGRDRPRCRGLHQVAGALDRRRRRRDRRALGFDLEQPRARSRAAGRFARQGGRRDARQRRQLARLRGALGAAARQGQGQQRLVRARPAGPAVRRELHDRRRAQRRR